MNLLSGVLYESQYHSPSSSSHHTLTSDGELIVGSILSIVVNSRVVVVILITPLQLGGEIIEEMFNLVELMEPPSQTTEALQIAVVAIPIITIIAHIANVWRDLSIVTIADSSLDGHAVRSNRVGDGMGIGNKIKEGNRSFLKRNNQINKGGGSERRHNNQ